MDEIIRKLEEANKQKIPAEITMEDGEVFLVLVCEQGPWGRVCCISDGNVMSLPEELMKEVRLLSPEELAGALEKFHQGAIRRKTAPKPMHGMTLKEGDVTIIILQKEED